VILPDANLLLYATDARSRRHAAARRWLEATLAGSETVAFAWAVLLAFIRVSTRAAMFENPLAPEQAFDLVDEWLAQSCAVVVNPGDRHAATVRELLRELGTAANLTSDAHLAAIAIEHRATLCSCDVDFARFSGVRWVDPLRAER
jgi:uncharacterized protein